MENKTIEILLHKISYYYNTDEEMEMTENDIEHIKEMIDKRCREGELCTTDKNYEEVYGWWKIVKEKNY